MAANAIRVEAISKKYRLGGTFSSSLRELANGMVGRGRKAQQEQAAKQSMPRDLRRVEGTKDHFWALHDVSFNVEEGDVLGVVGRNGAGKSTLLKILSRITWPTAGRVTLNGRVASLLEVGTGFHPELTGRENVFLNAAILGMARNEVRRRFDQIVAFAEIGEFIDTPVKRYSSGMYVRLAFAVAAHLDPEILIVDEVLAVGDAEFQAKCLGRLGEVSRSGRTVLFVSHNLSALSSLCRSAILIEGGRLQSHGPAIDVIEKYVGSIESLSKGIVGARTDRAGSGISRFESVALRDARGCLAEVVRSGSPCTIEFSWKGTRDLRGSAIKVSVYNWTGAQLIHIDSSVKSGTWKTLPGSGSASVRIAQLPLGQGRYRLNVALLDRDGFVDHVTGALFFTVLPSEHRSSDGAAIRDVCVTEHEWWAAAGENVTS